MKLTVALLGAAAALAAAAGPTVTIKAGTLQGRDNGLAHVFTSIPYAAPPTGAGRWAAPSAAAPWSGVKQATADPPGCPQTCGLPPHACPLVQSEDCLFLNVFTPRVVTEKLPVVVFIHGGNFKQGYSGGPLYDGTWMAAKHNVVVVTINYRLGALGSLYVKGVLPGAFAFLDQQFALQWVQDNIAAFGGNPGNVGIFGQSAGAASVALHNVAPSSKSLFHRSYMLSEPLALPLRTTETWEPLYQAYAEKAGCQNKANGTAAVECLAALPVAALVAAQDAAEKDLFDEYERIIQLFMPWTGPVETDLIPYRPIDAFHQGKVADPSKPLIITSVKNEGILFIYEAFPKPMSALEWEAAVAGIFLGNGGKIMKEFPLPANETTDARNHTAMVATLSLFTCATRYAMQGMTAPAYVGHFNHVMSFGEFVWGPRFSECYDKVCHGGDLPFIFHPNATEFGLTYTPGEQNLSMSMQSYWTSFMRGSVPLPPPAGPDAGIPWPRFNMTTQAYLALDTPANEVKEHSFDKVCDFFDEIGYDFY